MFFTMLKNDLKAHKGLNIILFIFIISASIVLVIASNLMYMELTGRTRTDRLSNIANSYMNLSVSMGNFETTKQKIRDWMQENRLIKDGELKEYIRLAESEVQINGVYASDDSFPSHDIFHITTKSQRINLLYTDSDKPFVVDTGEVAVSLDLADIAGIRRGDEIRITTQLGNVYSLKVSEIYKRAIDSNSDELIISDADFEYLKEENPLRNIKLLLKTDSKTALTKAGDELVDTGMVYGYSTKYYSPELDSDFTVLVVISDVLLAIGIVILLIMFITIRFMMVAAIKKEEKEIGMMRAIGVDSFKYRWMFAAVYITFAVIGGIAGIAAGVPISKYIIRQLCKNYINDNPYMVQIIALIVSVFLVITILGFSAIVMRKIRKISVIQTIHGSDTGERYRKLTHIKLYTSKKFKVPGFLAVADIVNSFGKYIFLIVSYMLAALILLTVFNLKSSLFSKDYSKNFYQWNYDFYVYYVDEIFNYYGQKGGSYEKAMKLLVEDFNKDGVPVHMRYMNETEAELLRENDDIIDINFMFGDTNNEGIPLRKGGKLPIKENELILSYFTAENAGIKVGDTVTLKFKEYNEDKISTHEVQKDFIVTGFYDVMEGGNAGAIVGEEYSGAFNSDIRITDLWIDAPEREKAGDVAKLKEKYGDNAIKTLKEGYEDDFNYVTDSIDMLKIIISVMMAFILTLNTMLYMTVDLARETPGIAMLKCSGFSNSDVRKWQMVRMLIILILAIITGYILEYTLVNYVAAGVFITFGVTRFHFVSNPVEAYVIVPGIITLIGLVAMRLCLIKVKGLNIWDIREE